MMPVVDALTRTQQLRIVEIKDAFTVGQFTEMMAVSQGAEPVRPDDLHNGLDILCGLLQRGRYRNTGGTTIAKEADRAALKRSQTERWGEVEAFRSALSNITKTWKMAADSADQVHHGQQ